MTLIELAIEQARKERTRLKRRWWSHPGERGLIDLRIEDLETKLRVWMEMVEAEKPKPKKQKKPEELPRKKLRVNGSGETRGYSWQGDNCNDPE